MADDAQQAASPAAATAAPPTTPPAAQAPTTAIDAALAPAATGSADDGTRKRPRDARLIHMILANQGVTAYQERVPLQLLDFCYRYTSATLQDALHLTAEFGQSVSEKGKVQGVQDLNAVSLASLRLSIGSRTHYQLSAKIGKEHLVELASERNKIALPPVGKEPVFRLPPERYVLSGVGWRINDGWESEGEEAMEVDGDGDGEAKADADEDVDEEVEGGRMEDLYGNHMEDEDVDMKEE